MKKKKDPAYWSTFIRGMGMGAADVVPGVSGGTIAFITGIYQRLIFAINAIGPDAFRTLVNDGLPGFWKKIDGNFLLTLFAGILVSVFSLAKLITWLLEEHAILIWSFFFGLIITSVHFVGKQVKAWRLLPVLTFIAGTAIAWYITTLPPMSTEADLWFVFVSGAIAVCAMILPGISGSFILLLMGSYEMVLNAIKNLDFLRLSVFAVGCAIGILSFARLMKWMFNHFYSATIALLAGFLLGSLNKVWPWKTVVESRIVDGEERVIQEKNILPQTFAEQTNGDPQLLYSCLLALLAGTIILLLERRAN